MQGILGPTRFSKNITSPSPSAICLSSYPNFRKSGLVSLVSFSFGVQRHPLKTILSSEIEHVTFIVEKILVL